MRKKRHVYNAKEAVSLALSLLSDRHKEHFITIYLDARRNVIKAEVVSIGTINSCLVHPREVFRTAIVCRACSVVCMHNHPSGGTEASEADKEVSKRLKSAGKLIGIEVDDNIIFEASGKFGQIGFWD
jgi:DNA repair protein RadC